MCCFHDGIGSLCHMLRHLQIEMHRPVGTFMWACNCVSSAGERWFIKAHGHLGSSTVLLIALRYETCKREIKQKCTYRAPWFILDPQKWSCLGIKCSDSSWKPMKALYWPKNEGIFLNLVKFHFPTYLTYRTIALRWAIVTGISPKMGRLSSQVLSQTYKLIGREL